MITQFSKAMLTIVEVEAPADIHRQVLRDMAAAQVSQFVRQTPQIKWEEFKIELHGWINFEEERSIWAIPMLVVDGKVVGLTEEKPNEK